MMIRAGIGILRELSRRPWGAEQRSRNGIAVQ